MTKAGSHRFNYIPIEIRLAVEQDQESIIRLQLKSLQVLSAKDYSPRELQALLASKKYPRNESELIYVAEINQQIIGFVALDRDSRHITGLFVDPEYTRMGIGSNLLSIIELEAKRSQIPILWVCSSLTGYPFYIANGYEKINTFSLLLGRVAIPCINLRKRLLPPRKLELKPLVVIALIAGFMSLLLLAI